MLEFEQFKILLENLIGTSGCLEFGMVENNYIIEKSCHKPKVLVQRYAFCIIDTQGFNERGKWFTYSK